MEEERSLEKLRLDSSASLVRVSYIFPILSFLLLQPACHLSCPCLIGEFLARDLSIHAKKKAQTAANTFPDSSSVSPLDWKKTAWLKRPACEAHLDTYLVHPLLPLPTFSPFTPGEPCMCSDENIWLRWTSIVDTCYNTYCILWEGKRMWVTCGNSR